MYRRFFGFDTHPFRNTPDPRFFFRSPAHEEALIALQAGMTRRQGMMLVTGDKGSGKTLLAHLLVHALGEQADAVILPQLPESGHELLTTLCRSFGIRYRASHSRSELLDRLSAHVLTRHMEGLDVLVILDEAGNMTAEVMELIRVLSELEYDSSRIFQLVLLGPPEFAAHLTEPAREELWQRISCSRELGSLEREQTHAYVRYRLRQAGCDREDLFTDGALDHIHEQSGGSPRLINQLADAALLSAYSASRRQIDRDLVAEGVRGLMAVSLARTPDAPDTPVTYPRAEDDPAHATVSPILEAIHEATRRGTEVLAGLDRGTHHAMERADRLNQLVSHSEEHARSAADSESALNRTSRTATQRINELQRHAEETRALITGLTSTRARIKRWHKHSTEQICKQIRRQRAMQQELEREIQKMKQLPGQLEGELARHQQQRADACVDAVQAVIVSAGAEHEILESLCRDAQETRHDLARMLEELMQCRQENQSLLERQEELQRAVAAQIRQSRKTSREVETAVRDAGEASGQAMSRTQELATRVNRAVAIVADLDARLLRAEKLAEQFQRQYDSLVESTRDANQATQQLRDERARTEELLRKLRRERNGRREDLETDSAEDDGELHGGIPTLRLRLSRSGQPQPRSEADDKSDDTHLIKPLLRAAQ